MLEQLARDVTGWPARAVEFFEQLAATQYMNHVRLYAPATADLRSDAHAASFGGAVQRGGAHRGDAAAGTGSGRYNIPNIGIFLWRLRPFPLSNVPLPPTPATRPAASFASTRWARISRCFACQ